MGHVIVNKYKLINLFTVVLLFFCSRYCTAQINNYNKDEKDSVIIPHSSDNKIKIFIFVKSNSKSFEKYRLLNNINSLEALGLINLDLFDITILSINSNDSTRQCFMRRIILDGAEFPQNFYIDPYCIILEKGKKFKERLKTKSELHLEKYLSEATDNEGRASSYLIILLEMIACLLISLRKNFQVMMIVHCGRK